jgi:hypothetical protein
MLRIAQTTVRDTWANSRTEGEIPAWSFVTMNHEKLHLLLLLLTAVLARRIRLAVTYAAGRFSLKVEWF